MNTDGRDSVTDGEWYVESTAKGLEVRQRRDDPACAGVDDVVCIVGANRVDAESIAMNHNATRAKWTATPEVSGNYWMNFRCGDGTYSNGTFPAEIRADDAEGMMYCGLHYSRSQWPEAMFYGPLKPPAPPDRSVAEGNAA